MNLWQQYLRPTTISEALIALTTASGPAIPIAGGTDLMLDLQQGRHAPVHTLVDLTSVREMARLEVRGEQLFIGAAIPVAALILDPLVQTHAQALVEAAGLIGGPQVRNVATLGGNVAHALPAADGTIALAALGAEAEIADRSGTRRVPFLALFSGPGRSALKGGMELLVGFYLPLVKSGEASAFRRIMRPQGVALPILNTAVSLRRDGSTVPAIRIAVGPAGPTPLRLVQAESALRGQPYETAVIRCAVERLLAEAHFRSSPHRASSQYRKHLISALFTDTLGAAWQRAGENY